MLVCLWVWLCLGVAGWSKGQASSSWQFRWLQSPINYPGLASLWHLIRGGSPGLQCAMTQCLVTVASPVSRVSWARLFWHNRKRQIPRYFEKQIRLVMRDVMETEWEEVGNTMGGAWRHDEIKQELQDWGAETTPAMSRCPMSGVMFHWYQYSNTRGHHYHSQGLHPAIEIDQQSMCSSAFFLAAKKAALEVQMSLCLSVCVWVCVSVCH